MKFKNLIAVVVLFAVFSTCFPTQLYAVSVEEAGKIESAMPDEPAVAPKKNRKMLVFSLCEGFKHSCIPYWEKVLEVMGEKTRAFECEFSKDMSVFNERNLKRFDAVCLNNTTQLKFNDDQRKAFMDFIKGGKGLVGIHAATDNFYDWQEAAEMMGGQFTAHPWTAGGTWAVKIDDPGHVLMKPFEGKGFKVNDEIYQTKAPLYSREKQRVLMSLDMADEATRNVKGFGEGDEDTGISWVKKVGNGRLFYCSLGHNHHLAWEPAVLEHYLLGIQFAMGDLDVDTEPIDPDAACATGTELDGIMKKVSAYDYGQSREALTELTDLIRDGHDDKVLLKEIEKELIGLLRSTSSLAAKQFACRQLSIIGTEESVPTLTLMLRKEDTADMALFALERIPSGAVDEALRRSVPLLFGNAKVGVINTLGVRRDSESVSVLGKLIENSDFETAGAAISALGRIGGKEAAEVLGKAKDKVEGNLQMLVLDAYLSCAEGLPAKGQTKEAQEIYSQIYESDAPVIIRIGALRGMVYSGGEDAGEIVVKAIEQSEPQIQSAAFMLVGEIEDSSKIKAIAARWSKLSVPAQVQLMTALANKGDSAALGAVTDAVKSENSEVKIAALKALGSVGDASSVNILAATAAASRGAERNAARESLYNLSGAGIDDAILQTVEKAKAPVQVELIRSIGQRGIDAAVETLVKTSASKDKGVQMESLKSLRVIAGEGDMASLVEILKSSSASAAKEAEKTIVAVGRKAVDKDKCSDVILDSLKSARKPEVKASLLGILGKLGDRQTLPALRKAVNDKNEKVKDAAIRALSEWPDAAAIEDVLKIAESTDNAKYRGIALRGYVRMVGMAAGKPAGEQAKMYEKAMSLASSSGEKKAVLAGLGGVKSAIALELAASCLDDKDLQQEAELAVVKIAQSVFESSPEKTKAVLEKVLSVSKNDTVREEAQEILNEISGP